MCVLVGVQRLPAGYGVRSYLIQGDICCSVWLMT